MLMVSHLRARRVLTLYCIRYTGVTPSWPRGLTSRSAHARTHEALCAVSREGWQSQKCRVNRSANVRGLNISAARGLSKERRVISLWTALYMPPALCSKLGSRRGGGGRLAPCSRGAASRSGGRLPPDHLQSVTPCYTRPTRTTGHTRSRNTRGITHEACCAFSGKGINTDKVSSQRGIGGDPHSRPRERRLTYGRPARFRCVATATAPSSFAASPPPTLTFHVRMRAAACFTAGPEAQAREEGRAESTAALAASAAASREEASPLASSPLMRTYAHSPPSFRSCGGRSAGLRRRACDW